VQKRRFKKMIPRASALVISSQMTNQISRRFEEVAILKFY
jgi:hypothetical protein